jgi:hypothetical protein
LPALTSLSAHAAECSAFPRDDFELSALDKAVLVGVGAFENPLDEHRRHLIARELAVAVLIHVHEALNHLRWVDLAAAHAWALTILAWLAWLARCTARRALIPATLIPARRERAVLLGECER